MVAWCYRISCVLPIVAPLLASRATAQQRVMVPVSSDAPHGTAIRLETFIYRPAGTGPFPVVLLSHGSADGDARASTPAPELARYFVQHGFAVLVPMRRGRGMSTGRSREYEERHCVPAAWEPGLQDAMDDLSAALEYAGSRPEFDTTHVVLAGVSRGGFLSIAYAAEGRHRNLVVGAINFVGAWIAQREDQCPQDFNALSFANFGRRTRVPTLWLYGDGDPYNTTQDIRGYISRFRAAGGDAAFDLFHDVPGNGHDVADAPRLWGSAVDAFLNRLRVRTTNRSRMPANER